MRSGAGTGEERSIPVAQRVVEEDGDSDGDAAELIGVTRGARRAGLGGERGGRTLGMDRAGVF